MLDLGMLFICFVHRNFHINLRKGKQNRQSALNSHPPINPSRPQAAGDAFGPSPF